MRKERKHFTPEEKVAILRRHLVDKVPVSELFEELGLRPTVFYRSQKELFENGAAAFQSQQRPQRQVHPPLGTKNYSSLATATACFRRHGEFTTAISIQLRDGFWYFVSLVLKPTPSPNSNAVIGSPPQGAPMKEIYEILQQKEADLAHVRKEIHGLRIVGALLSNESSSKDAFELLQQKEACVARVRHEVESLQIVAPLLSEEYDSDEPTGKAATSAEETSESIHGSEATGTDGMFSSFSANLRPKLWRILKGKT